MTPGRVMDQGKSSMQFPVMPTGLRNLWDKLRFFVPIALSLAVFWRVPFTWFRIDDFAWLGLWKDVHSAGDMVRALFEPQAQGTIRVLSERLHFLILGGVFGLHAWPFRLVALGTWCVNLILIQAIGERLTGSRAAGFLAAMFWSVAPALVTPLAWASAYNQLLCMFCVLGAFYCRLRWIETQESKWRALEAGAYLLGFGALEIIVVYPAIVMLHALAAPSARPYWRTALWMCLPAGLFGAAHFFLIPKDPSDVYRLFIDKRLSANLLHYFGWTIGPSDRDAVDPVWQGIGMSVTVSIGVLMLGFLAFRAVARDKMVFFLVGWFLLFLAPVLPLANHVNTYYLSIPGIGLAWLAGWALVYGYRVHHPVGIALMLLANGLALGYGLGAIAQVQALTAWNLQVTSRMRAVVRLAEDVAASHPGNTLVLQGVDDELFRAGFRDDPFRLTGVEKTVLAPGNVDELLDLPEFKEATQYKTTSAQLLPLLDAGKARVVNVSTGDFIDITDSYQTMLRSEFMADHRNTVEVGDPAYVGLLGRGWFAIENRARWMGKSAAVTLPGPQKAGESLYVTGFAAPGSLANGKVILSAKVNGEDIGWAEIQNPGHPFTFEYDIPAKFLNAYSIQVTLDCDKTFRPPGDPRDLGAVIQKLEVK